MLARRPALFPLPSATSPFPSTPIRHHILYAQGVSVRVPHRVRITRAWESTPGNPAQRKSMTFAVEVQRSRPLAGCQEGERPFVKSKEFKKTKGFESGKSPESSYRAFTATSNVSFSATVSV